MSGKRKSVLVSREFQLVFILRLVALVAVGGVLGGIGIYTAAGMVLRTYSEHVQILSPRAEFHLLLSIAIINGLVILLVSAAAAWLSMATLHRLVGPLVRLESVVHEVGEGNLDVQPTLRKRDELQKFPAALSLMLRRLVERVNRLRDTHARLREKIESTRHHAADRESLLSALREAEAVVAEFTTPEPRGLSRARRKLGGGKDGG